MLEKKDYVCGVIITYVFLVMLFFVFQEEYIVENPCSYDEPCVRFCCKNNSLCTDSFIRENFNGSLVKNEDNEDQKDFIILYGKPKCVNIEINSNETTSRMRFLSFGTLKFDGSYYDTQEYCFQENAGNPKSWNLNLCELSAEWQKILQIFLSSVTLLLLSATFLTYAYFSELRKTVGGKSFMAFTFSYIILFFGIVLEHFEIHRRHTWLFFITGFLFSFMWLTVLNFDVWYSLRNPEYPQDDPKRFKIYCYFAFGTSFISLAIGYITFQFNFNIKVIFISLYVLFLLIKVLDVVFLLLAGWKIYQNSKSDSEDIKFLVENERFWMYLELYAIMVIVWTLELSSLVMNVSENSLITADIVCCFSAAVAFGIFVLNKDAQKLLSDRYKSL